MTFDLAFAVAVLVASQGVTPVLRSAQSAHRALLDRIDAGTAMQTGLDARIEVLIELYRRRIELLATIPGVSPTTAPEQLRVEHRSSYRVHVAWTHSRSRERGDDRGRGL